MGMYFQFFKTFYYFNFVDNTTRTTLTLTTMDEIQKALIDYKNFENLEYKTWDEQLWE